MQITQKPKGKTFYHRLKSPISLVIHSTENPDGNSTFESEVKYLYETNIASAEYLVGEYQVIEFLDPDKYCAWHAGVVSDQRFSNVNSIGIETHYSRFDTKPIAQGTKNNLTVLVGMLIKKYRITSPAMIAMHRSIAYPLGRKLDPTWISDTEFNKWRNSFFNQQEIRDFTTLIPVAILTAPRLNAPVASHVTDGFVTRGIIPAGKVMRGKLVKGDNGVQFVWLVQGWGFIPYESVV